MHWSVFETPPNSQPLGLYEDACGKINGGRGALGKIRVALTKSVNPFVGRVPPKPEFRCVDFWNL